MSCDFVTLLGLRGRLGHARCKTARRHAGDSAASIDEDPACSDWAGPFLNLAYDEMLQVFR